MIYIYILPIELVFNTVANVCVQAHDIYGGGQVALTLKGSSELRAMHGFRLAPVERDHGSFAMKASLVIATHQGKTSS